MARTSWRARPPSGPSVSRAAPLAYAAVNAAIYQRANLALASGVDLEARNRRVVGRSRAVKEGVKAFLEKRKPDFKGE